MSDDLYQAIILDHYHEPVNFGKPEHFDIELSESNGSCGDAFTFYFSLSQNKLLSMHFEGEGCAISTAACSILSEAIKNKSLSQIEKFSSEDLSNLLGIHPSPARAKCLQLPLRAVKQAIEDHTQK